MFAFDKRKIPIDKALYERAAEIRRASRLRVCRRLRGAPPRARAATPRRGAGRGAGEEAPRGARLHRLTAAHDFLARSFDLLLGPLDRWSPVAGLWAASVVAGVVLLFIFRWTSNARGDSRRAPARASGAPRRAPLSRGAPRRAARPGEVSRRHRPLSRADARPLRGAGAPLLVARRPPRRPLRLARARRRRACRRRSARCVGSDRCRFARAFGRTGRRGWAGENPRSR